MIKKGVLFICVVLMILFSRFFPVYYAYSNTPEGYVYAGQTSAYDPWDINVYVAAIRYGQHGNITLKNQYTTQDDREAFIYSLYTISGNLFKSVDPYIIYHSLAGLTIILSCIVIFIISNAILHDFYLSLVSVFLVLRGGGFGWLCVKLFGDAIPSADLFYSNITFTSALQKPHDGIGTLALVVTMLMYFLYISRKKPLYAYMSTLSLVILMFFYPYYMLSYGLIVGAYVGYMSVRSQKYAISVPFIMNMIIAAIIAVFSYISIKQSGFSLVTGETIDKLSLLSFVSGYGVFILIFLIAYAKKNLPIQHSSWNFLVWWVIASVFCSYLPIGYSRFYLRGLFFPLVISTLLWVQQYQSHKVKIWIICVLCIIMPLTSIYVFFDRIQKAAQRDPWQYTRIETDEMFKFLETRKRDGVLSAYRLGNFVPAKTNKTVYLGHLFQTPDAQERMNNIFDFYSGSMTDKEALTFLKENELTFVIYGIDEKKLGGHIYPFLQLQFNGNLTKLYSL